MSKLMRKPMLALVAFVAAKLSFWTLPSNNPSLPRRLLLFDHPTNSLLPFYGPTDVSSLIARKESGRLHILHNGSQYMTDIGLFL